LYRNSGNFKQTLNLLYPQGDVFEKFFAFSLWVYAQTHSTWQISLDRLAKLIFTYLNTAEKLEEEHIAQVLIHDLMKIEGRVLPAFLKPYAPQQSRKSNQLKAQGHNKRQLKHLQL